MSGDVTAPVTAALFGLDGFVVLAAADAGGEVELLVETAADLVGCPECGAVARAKDRHSTWVRDLPVGEWPVVMCWHKRVWCCPHVACPVKTWTEAHPAITLRACLTERARVWAFEQVGARDAAVAAGLGVAWWTIMNLTIEAGTPIVGDPQRLADVDAIGVDAGGWLAARDPDWRDRIDTASLDPFRGYATALATQLPDTIRVLDPLPRRQAGPELRR